MSEKRGTELADPAAGTAASPVAIPVPGLRAALARALGMPVTQSWQGTPIVHGTFTARDLASLTELHLDGLGIEDITGLQFARNLRILTLNDNRITDISPLEPAVDPESGTPVGTRDLQSLSLDNNPLASLSIGTQGSNTARHPGSSS